jgi:hypothetical protein
MGSRIPKTMIPEIVINLETVSQYSISPYRRTLKLLKRIGIKAKTEIQTAGFTLGSQMRIIFCAATSLEGNATTYANQ